MMTNLFSTFDPSTSMNLSINWMSTFIVMIMLPPMFWINPSRIMMLTNMISMSLHKEYKTSIKNKKGFTIMFTSMFMFILMNNMFGLLPYVFTSSSHLTFTLSLALPMWISLMLFGWINQTQHMFSHLIPLGTPNALMPFMVMIETISNLIRPMSLAVRLTANMIAGHLLMTLMGNNMINTNYMNLPLLIMFQMGLTMFETAVSIIQAYVFSVLSTLYSSEIYENP